MYMPFVDRSPDGRKVGAELMVLRLLMGWLSKGSRGAGRENMFFSKSHFKDKTIENLFPKDGVWNSVGGQAVLEKIL